MFKLHIGDVPKPISDLFQTNNNYHSYSTRNSQALRTLIGKSEAIYQTFTYIESLAWNYISSKYQPMGLIYVFKTFQNYICKETLLILTYAKSTITYNLKRVPLVLFITSIKLEKTNT